MDTPENGKGTSPGAGNILQTNSIILALDAPFISAIRSEHEAALAAASTACEHARRAGGLLLKAKEQLPHGAWLPWLEANFTFSARTAQVYMRVSEGWKTISNTQTSAHLSIDEAVKLLAEPIDRSEVLLREATKILADFAKTFDPSAYALTELIVIKRVADEAVSLATSYSLNAERKLGQLLNQVGHSSGNQVAGYV